jgi:hypothetical protein
VKADGGVAKVGAVRKVNGIAKAGAVPKGDGTGMKAGGIVTALEEASGIKFSFFWLAGHLRLRATKRY